MRNIRALELTPIQRRLLLQLYAQPGLTRGELARAAQISEKSAIKYVLDFLDDGIVTVREARASTGGRRAETLALNPDWFTVLAADVGGYSTKIGVMKLNGELLYRREVSTMDSVKLNKVTAETLLEELQTALTVSGAQPVGVGIGVSGLIEHATGRVKYCPNVPGLESADLAGEIRKKLELPLYLETSARCLARAEQHYGGHAETENVIYVSVGHSISAGIVLGGQIYRGGNDAAGEIGHLKIGAGEKYCSCGGKGCLELHATLAMITEEIRRRASAFYGYTPLKELVTDWDALTPAIVNEALARNDRITAEVLEEAGCALGSAVAAYVNAFNPQLVVFGGSVAALYPAVIDEAIRQIRRESLSALMQGLRITTTKLEPAKAAIAGAALLVTDAVFGRVTPNGSRA